jgi:hypothetical protein
MGTQKNSEFAQMQDAEKNSPRHISAICKQENFSATQHNQRLSCRLYDSLVEWPVAYQLGYNEVAVQAHMRSMLCRN